MSIESRMKLEDWYGAIHKALLAHDPEAVAGLIGLMAVNGYAQQAEELRTLVLLLDAGTSE